MTNKNLAIFGIVAYIFSFLTTGYLIIPITFFSISGIIMMVFIFMAIIRLRRFDKIVTILFAILTVILIILESVLYNIQSADGSSFMLLVNIFRMIGSVVYVYAIGLLLAIGKLQEKAINSLKKTGFSSKDIEALSKEKKENTLSKIIELQEEAKQTFQKSTGINPENIIPIIGEELISWAEIVNDVFRVLELDRNNSINEKNNQLKTKNNFEPYGYLLAESPILNNKVKIPILNIDDYTAITEAFNKPDLIKSIFEDKSYELLVAYVPKYPNKDGLPRTSHHSLHYLITLYRTLDKYYSMNNDCHMAIPEPQLLFGRFSYVGENKIIIKPDIKL